MARTATPRAQVRLELELSEWGRATFLCQQYLRACEEMGCRSELLWRLYAQVLSEKETAEEAELGEAKLGEAGRVKHSWVASDECTEMQREHGERLGRAQHRSQHEATMSRVPI